MKKTLFIFSLLLSSFAFSQVAITSESKNIDDVYKGGSKQLVNDVEKNFDVFSSEYQVNGKFILTFDLDKNGKITHPKVLPETDPDFANALIRSFKRIKNNFKPNMPTNKLAILFDFNPTFKNGDARDRFTESPSSERFQTRN